MLCFAHSTEPAVGICKVCGKGVCRSCAIQVRRGLACSEVCKPAAEGLSRWHEVEVRNVGVAGMRRIIQPLMAILFLGLAIYAYFSFGTDPLFWMALGAGAIFALITAISWIGGKTGGGRGPEQASK